MLDFPPLPRYLTLEEAADALTERTGKRWTQRQILGCAERHEITVFARIGHAVKFVRAQPIEGRTNEISADKGSLPILDTEAIRALLLAGEARSTGWEEMATMDFFGEPIEAWQKIFELAPGEEAPLVTPDGCRVTSNGVLQLVETYSKSADLEGSHSVDQQRGSGTLSKLSEEQKAEVVKLYARGRGESVNRLAKKYQVSRPIIDKILRVAGVKI